MASEASTSSAPSSKTVDEQPSPIGTNLETSGNDGEPQSELSDEEIQKCLTDADELKYEGTQHFREQEWSQALAKYNSALGRLPKRPSLKEPRPYEKDDHSEEAGGHREEDKTREDESKEAEVLPTAPPLEGLQGECARARAVLNANIGACHVKLEEYKDAVKACTDALADDPTYIKALQRRVSCNEHINSWSSLAGAQEDYNALLKILPPDSPQLGPTRRALAALKPRVEEAQKKETGEVLEKLKGVGNSILGNFGLSTDNFKFVPNGQGGYSVNFQR